jgi:PIN domain nuclease of toxin-antitoxin system
MPSVRHDVLLDTHALLWWRASGTLLSADAAAAIANAPRVLISPISCWEVAMLVHKGRVALDRPVGAWIHAVLAADRMVTADLTPAIAVAAGGLENLHGDPADRIIYATASALSVPLITKDQTLADHARGHRDISVVW